MRRTLDVVFRWLSVALLLVWYYLLLAGRVQL